MSLAQKILALAAPLSLVALSGCATGFPAEVQRFQAMPAPQGQSFAVVPADPEAAGGLEFSQYAAHVRQHMSALGYVEAASPAEASLIVTMGYGVDHGRERLVASPDPWATGYGLGYGGRYRPFYSRYGYYGRSRHPFYWGWHDPFRGGGYDVRSYTVYTSFLDLDIRRAADGQSVFEGLAQARSATDDLPVLVPNLVEAMFTGFPGNSGETVRITVEPERARRR